MTKEEILNKHGASSIYNDGHVYDGGTPEIFEAMDEWAKQKSIAFAEWVAINEWYFNKIKRWSNRNESSDNLIEVLTATKTTEELYTLFLNQSL